MKIQSIILKNIGPHKDLTIDFSDLGSVIAITGENGQGKTFLIEAVVACLYGVFPSRPGSLYDRMTQGYEGEAEIVIVFEMSGVSYKATRKLKRSGKSTSSTADLINLDAPLKIAGPKTTDFEAAVINLLGTYDLFMASVFSSQGNSGDICSARPAERKAVFGQLLGLGRFDQLADSAKKRAGAAEVEVVAQEREIRGLRERVQGLPGEEKALSEALTAKNQTDNSLTQQKATVDALEANIKAGEIALEKWRQMDNQLKKLDEEIRRAEKERDNDLLEYARLKELAVRAPEVDQAEQGMVEATEHREAMQKELAAVEKENGEARLAYERKQSEIKTAMVERENKRRQFTALSEQASLLEKTPKQDCCNGCSLVASAVKTAAELPAVSAEYDRTVDRVDNLNRNIGSLELRKTDELETAIATLSAMIDKARRIMADAAAIREAQGSMKTLQEAGKAKKVILDSKKVERDNVSRETSEAWGAIAGYELDDVLDGEKRKAKDIENALSSLTTQIGALRERIAGMEAASKQADALEATLEAIRTTISDYRTIEQAFGRSGIQPLIIEQARPELEDIAGEMLGQATAGRMAVRVETQKENKDQTIAETLDIIITMDGMERKIEELSGGEQKMIRTAVRLTLAVWQARRGGSRLKTIFIDEVADALDGENSDRVLTLLTSLVGQFDRIFIISHDDDLLAELPVRINITRKGAEINR